MRGASNQKSPLLPEPYGRAADPSLEDLLANMELGEMTSPQMAAEVLREAIITGVLPGGTSIRQDVVAEKLGASKIPVREALRELEGQGLVVFTRNKGFMVSEASAEEMREAFKLRRMLELFAVRESVPLTTAEGCDRIEAIIQDFEKITDIRVSSHWNLKLHLAFYAAARMEHLNRMIRRAHTIAHRYTHIYMRAHEETIDPQDEHRAILEAYRARDVDLAVTLMDSHISVAANAYASFLRTYFDAQS